MSQLQIDMLRVQSAIFKNDYYVNLYHQSLAKFDIHPDAIEHHNITDAVLVSLCHDFWTRLPDTAMIRREPFFAICDIAEHIFDEPVDTVD